MKTFSLAWARKALVDQTHLTLCEAHKNCTRNMKDSNFSLKQLFLQCDQGSTADHLTASIPVQDLGLNAKSRAECSNLLHDKLHDAVGMQMGVKGQCDTQPRQPLSPNLILETCNASSRCMPADRGADTRVGGVRYLLQSHCVR